MIASWKTLGFQDRVLEKAWFSRPQMAVQDLRSLLLRSPLGGTDPAPTPMPSPAAPTLQPTPAPTPMPSPAPAAHSPPEGGGAVA